MCTRCAKAHPTKPAALLPSPHGVSGAFESRSGEPANADAHAGASAGVWAGGEGQMPHNPEVRQVPNVHAVRQGLRSPQIFCLRNNVLWDILSENSACTTGFFLRLPKP